MITTELNVVLANLQFQHHYPQENCEIAGEREHSKRSTLIKKIKESPNCLDSIPTLKVIFKFSYFKHSNYLFKVTSGY